MAAHSDLPEPELGSGVHNSVLIRTHEPMRESHAWLAPALVGTAIVIGAAIWGFMATHPTGPVVNNSVANAPTAKTAFSTS
jgi:hypothetical protein